MSDQELVLELARRLNVSVKIETKTSEKEEAVKLLPKFDPAEEIRAGRYVWDDELKLGKLTRPYQEPRFDCNGRQVMLASFQDDNISYIDAALLPDDCFVPTRSQMTRWLTKRVGEDWCRRPKEVLTEFGVKLYGDAYGGKVDGVGDLVSLASASRGERGDRYFLGVGRDDVGFIYYVRWQCGFVPVFFGPEFLGANNNGMGRV